MKVQLVSHTPHALELLIYTKNTRLQGKQTIEDIIAWTDAQKADHLGYMLDTIKSSWEFVSYTFEISEVTRAFTHQLVRTRNASYAQEAQRAVDVSDSSWLTPAGYDPELESVYNESMQAALENYSDLLNGGMQRQDARGVIPTNIHTSIMMTANLRTLHQMAEIRLCYKAQGEYQEVFRAMRDEVVKVHPWAKDFIKVYCANHGTCCFPRFTECPIQKYTYNAPDVREAHSVVLDHIETLHDNIRYEANPVAKDGKA